MIMNLSIGIAFVRSLPRAVSDSERKLVAPRSLSPICESNAFASGSRDGQNSSAALGLIVCFLPKLPRPFCGLAGAFYVRDTG